MRKNLYGETIKLTAGRTVLPGNIVKEETKFMAKFKFHILESIFFIWNMYFTSLLFIIGARGSVVG
jgi:hypothetical protein